MSTKVIVIGGGLSGLSSAHTVLEHGGTVLLLDKNPFCGGNSTKATSGINASDTKTQIRKGIKDSNESFEADTVRSSHLGQPGDSYPLAKVLAKGSGPAVEWLTNTFGIDLSLVSRLGGHSFERTHRGKERFPGMTITYALLERLEEIEKKSGGKTARILTKAKATKLIKDGQGRVVGVEYERDGQTHKEEGIVIICSGGFAADFADDSLLKKHRPDLMHLPTTNGAHCTGDGIKMAEAVGGASCFMEWVQVHPTGLVHPDEPNAKVKFLAAEALRGCGGILIDRNGNRFCDELGRRDYVTGEMNKNQGPFRLILNTKAANEIGWHCKHYVGRKLMKQFNSGEELAKEMGISPDVLKNTFDTYNEVAKKGTDQYGKKYFQNTPLQMNETYHVSIVTPVLHYCMGGIKINEFGEVVTAQDKPVPGLFSAGEVTGGVHGKNRLGGNALLECVVIGRVAGKSASQYLLRSAINSLSGNRCSQAMGRLETLRNQLKQCEELELTNTYYNKTTTNFLVGNKTAKTTTNYLKLEGSEKQSKISGGTAGILPKERAKSSFNVETLIHFMNGGKEMTKRRKFIEKAISEKPEDMTKKNNFTREEYLKEGVREFIAYHKAFSNFKPTRRDIFFMSESSYGGGSLNNSHSIFALTIVGQGTDEQQKYWGPKILNFSITGSYAQTELGHGSNVRGLQTTATFDPKTDEFVMNTPTLQSIKWWPGCLGKVGTHAVVYAQLMLNGEEKGIYVFMMQVRDENHLPLKGITLGDVGNKMGDNGNDTGFMILDNVRIPRTHMLSKYTKVTKEGKVEQVLKVDSKVHYFTMMSTRGMMVGVAGARLAQACTIAIRYSAVREQGFVDNKAGVSYLTKENQIIDYKIQQYRLFKQLANAYALKLTGIWILNELTSFESNQLGNIIKSDGLKEIASTSAGLKSLCTLIAVSGIEDCRKCCGGNGYLLSSGISQLSIDYLWQITAEGDYIILSLLTARYLLKCIGNVMGGKHLTGIVEYLNVIASDGFSLEKVFPGDAKNSVEFTNLDYLLGLFRYRSILKNVSVAQDFNEQVSNGAKFEEAWNNCANDLLSATYAHSYYIILSNFVNKVKESKHDDIVRVLTRLAILFACTNFLDDNWGDILSNNQFRLINQTITNVMAELRPDAVSLVDAFDYPDKVLKSTIGRYDGNVYEALFDAAQRSILNQTDPFDGYAEYLKPHLNIELLKRGNKPIQVPQSSPKL